MCISPYIEHVYEFIITLEMSANNYFYSTVFSMLQINTSVSDGNMFSGDCKRNMSGVWWQGNMVVDRATGTKKTDLSTSLKSLVYLV